MGVHKGAEEGMAMMVHGVHGEQGLWEMMHRIGARVRARGLGHVGDDARDHHETLGAHDEAAQAY